MTRQGETDLNTKTEKALSELRTMILGVQVLLGFQYQTIFLPGFDALPRMGQEGIAIGAAMLIAISILLIGPATFHSIAERGHASARVHSYVKVIMVLVLLPFAVVIGMNAGIVLMRHMGEATALWAAAGITTLAILFWFVIPLLHREGPMHDRPDYEETPLAQRVSMMLTQSRIILPGVQALLGFQCAAYFTVAFNELSATDRSVHMAGLLFLSFALILLIAPASYHRIAEHNENTESFQHIGQTMTLAALVPLALGMGCVIFVILDSVDTHRTLALAGGGISIAAALLLWFGVPLMARRKKDAL